MGGGGGGGVVVCVCVLKKIIFDHVTFIKVKGQNLSMQKNFPTPKVYHCQTREIFKGDHNAAAARKLR